MTEQFIVHGRSNDGLDCSITHLLAKGLIVASLLDIRDPTELTRVAKPTLCGVASTNATPFPEVTR